MRTKKPVDNPQHISLLAPTRNRTAKLERLFDSIEKNTSDKTLVDIWLYIDSDDRTTRDFIDQLGQYTFKIKSIVGERTKSQGEMVNILWRKSTTNAGIYMPVPDDYVFVVNAWDEVVRDTFNRFPDRILLAYPEDPTASPNQVTFIVLSAEWINILGRIVTDYFPFWFDDTWLDQVSQMVQKKIKLNIKMSPQGGKGETPRMKNLLFWQGFFDNTMDERIEDARKLRGAIYQKGSVEYKRSEEEGNRLARVFRAKAVSEDVLMNMEKNLSDPSWYHDPHKIVDYMIIEGNAVNHLLQKLGPMFDQNRYNEALDILKTILYSSRDIKDLHYLRSVCLNTLGRRQEAEIAALRELELQPGDYKTLHLLEEMALGDNKHDVLGMKGQDTEEFNKKGEVLFAHGDLNGALNAFTKAIETDPNCTTAYNNIGVLHWQDSIQKALFHFKKALELDPDNKDAVLNIGDLYKSLDQYDNARKVYSSYLLRHPNNSDIAQLLSYAEETKDIKSNSIQTNNTKHSKTGIIIFGHSRLLLLRNLLESLRRQGTTNDIHVWLDGHHGRASLKGPVETCREIVKKEFPQVHLTVMNGNIGIEKMTIDGLDFMAQHYERIIVLEDDCFPVKGAIAEFEKELDEIESRQEIYSVYGHHFLTESEGETITRFQGWGWATTREKLLPILAEIKRCFAMSEPDFLWWVRQSLTPEVIKRLDVTPGRNCVPVITSFFCWDGCTCLITAMRGLVHKKTRKRVIYNCGMGGDSTHFQQNDRFRQPPFNMISPEEVWDYFHILEKSPENSSPAVITNHLTSGEDELVVDGIRFVGLRRTTHNNNSVGYNSRYVIKIEHEKLEEKLRSLAEEAEVLKYLNARDCVSCPKLVGQGTLATGEAYMIQERVEGKPILHTADMVFSILEQKSMGVCQGDFKRDNFVLSNDGFCYVIDYDQAIIDQSIAYMGNIEYLEWVEHYFSKRWNVELYHFMGSTKNEVLSLFKNDAFNLAQTTIFQKQITTDTDTGIYHTLNTDRLFIQGVRDIKARSSSLDKIVFARDERVLDVGCNVGLLCHYLCDRGCWVTGIDMDKKITISAKMVANILHKDIEFKWQDLDTDRLEVDYDTVCLFSVIHHVKHFREVTENIARRCRRIIIESRLKESGSKPVQGKWTNTTAWNFNSIEEMASFFETIFPGFKIYGYHGSGDRERHIMSLVKPR